MKTQAKGPFLGINNRLPDFALHVPKTGDFLRDAVNVDITNSGNIVRRSSASLIQALTVPHSLHMVDDTNGYLVLGAVLYAITLPTYTQTFVTTLSNNDPVSYVEIGGVLYYSNGTDSGKLVGGTAAPWGFPTPTTPAVTNIAGSLEAGWYQVAVCHRNSVSGEEGGASPSRSYQLASTGGLRITLPAAVPGANVIDIYVSTLNGSVPFYAATVASGVTTVDIINENTRGKEVVQRHEKPLPAGRLFAFQGALCSYKDNEIYEGIPYRPGYCLQVGSRIPFVGDVSNAIPTENGVYVVADETFWLAGPVMSAAEKVSPLLPYGGVPGTAFEFPDDSKRVGWFGADGIVIADKLGQLKAVMADNIDLTAPASGVSTVLTDRGYLRVVSCGWCLNLENNAATRYTGYGFTSTSGDYGTKADGIYELSATGKVDASVNLGKENFGAEEKKALPAIYLGVQSETPMMVTVTTPKDGSYDYTARSCNGDDLELHRVDPGKGLRANWYDLTISNTDGSDFTLASVSFAAAASTRRI